MTSYRERKDKTRVFVLRDGDDIIGVYGNLKKMCEMAESIKLKGFPSYWTLARKNKDSGFPVRYNQYTIDYIKLH